MIYTSLIENGIRVGYTYIMSETSDIKWSKTTCTNRVPFSFV